MYIPLEKLIDKADNNMFKLVHMASARALQLADGAPRAIEALHDMKVTTIAMLEIAQEKIRLVPSSKAEKAEKVEKEEA